MTLANPTPWMDDAGPPTAEDDGWPYACDPPADDTEAGIYERTGVRGLIEWRGELAYVAKRRAERGQP